MFRMPQRFALTYVLIALNVAVYICTSLRSGDAVYTSDYVLTTYGQNNQSVFNGAYWQLITAIFIHASIVHLFGNMLFLLIFGLRAEELFDAEEYLLIYVLSGFAGNLLTLLYGPYMVSVGASGAIFGMFGAVVIYARRAIGQSIMGALMFAFLLLVINIGAEVNVLAHLGGLVVGLLMGYALAITRRSKPARTYRYNYSYSTGS
jgi:rhomboid protease GluP